MSEITINKVTESGILSLDLADFYPRKEQCIVFDLKPFLFMELVLREKDFREALKNHDWLQYAGKYVGVTCTADAIIPVWAYMLAAVYLQPVAIQVVMAGENEMVEKILLDNIKNIKVDEFADKRVVVKGCGELPIGEAAYLEVANKLRPVVKSIMYGEPCSTVPIYKKKA